MKVSLIALACTALLGATSAMADGRRGDYDHNNRDRHGYDSHYGHGRDDWRDGRHNGYDRYDRHDHDRRHYGYNNHNGPHHRWSRGGYYRNGGYVVRDYGSYHLRHPGYGYHWVRDGSDYLLVALATGLIADVVINGYDD